MRELVRTRRYKVGYEVRTEQVSGDEAGGGEPFEMRSAFTPSGAYIGNPKTAHRLVVKRGIQPELRESGCDGVNVCSIGFCEKEQKWYGWSHRAIHGFGIGDVVDEGDCCASPGWTDEWLAEHPEADESLPVGFTAKTGTDCKRMAVAFAESVG